MRRRSASSTSTCEPVELERLPDGRHAADAGQHVAADGLEALGLDRHVQPIAHLVDAGLGAEHPRSVALVHDRLGLDVVLVADLADDLLEQVLERHQPGRPAVLVDHDRHLHLAALEFLQELGHALGLGHEHRRTHEARDRLPVRVRFGDEDQVLDEDDALDVVEILVEDRDARILLLAEERPQLAESRIRRDGNDVWTRRHDLAHEGVAEIDDRLQEGPLLALDQVLLLHRFDAVGRLARALLGGARDRVLALAPAVDDQADERAGQRVQEAGGKIERRQQELEGLLGVAAHDEERQHVLEEQDEHRHEQQQHPDRGKALRAGEHGEHDRGEREDQAEHQPRRHEELDGIVEVEPEAVVAAAALDHQPQRQPHQGAEGGLDRADVDGGERQEQQEGNHRAARRAPCATMPAPLPVRSSPWPGRPCGAASPRGAPSGRGRRRS